MSASPRTALLSQELFRPDAVPVNTEAWCRELRGLLRGLETLSH